VGAGYDAARNFAENYFAADSNSGGDLRYLFITDGVNGFFFADNNSNGTMDAAVVLGLRRAVGLQLQERRERPRFRLFLLGARRRLRAPREGGAVRDVPPTLLALARVIG
jgi:hypothetical protein